MGSYYHDHPSYNEPSSAPSYSQNDQHTSPPPPDNSQIGGGILRGCSVRGCNAILPSDYALKMCEHCRERHRVYANTKRLKRKMEKMAIGQQAGLLSNVVWMDNEDQDETAQPQQPGPSQQSQVTQSPEPAPPPPQPQYGFSPTSWDNSAIDPRLFTHNSSSELAGALTLPTPQHLHPHAQRHAQPPAPPMAALLPPEGHEYPPVASTSRAPAPPPPPPVPSNENPHHLPTYPPINSLPPPRTEISAKAISEAAEQMGDTALPHRYCSIKGCKAVVPGNSFFKMCEPCRNRYRSYGTTKRAKWRREKEAAVAELQKLRVEEDKRRAENGLPPLTDTEAQWSGYQAPPSPSSSSQQPPLPPSPTLPTTRSPYAQVSPSLAPRMCTVSHCREILPGEYEFLRCERHRIQNRHHSKLKRVRDKESKAVAFDDWAAAVTAQAHKEEEEESGGEEEEEEAMSGDNAEHTDHFVDPQVIPPSEPNLGLPPAARGTRRTNHVCSIKVCYNLLSPNNPWKMCDTCRARDRTARRIKALRDSGIDVPPLPPRVKSPKPEGEQGKKGKKKKGKKKGISAEEVVNDVEGRGENATTGSGSSGSSNNPTPNANASGSGIGESSSITQTGAPPMLVFMDPILSDDPSPFVDPLSNTAKATTNNASNGRLGELSFILADENGNIREPPEVVGSTTSEKESAPPPAASTSTLALAVTSEPTPAPARKKRSSKKKDKAAKSNGGNASASTASTSSSNAPNASTSTAPAATSAASAPSTGTQPASTSTAPGAPDTSSIYIQPSYNVPYYMPPPFTIPPYAPGTRYPPYGGYSRDPYAPSTMYQPPPYPYAYPPYPPPPPPPGYGQYPPPQMHTFPPVPPPPGITPGLAASGPPPAPPPPASSSPASAVTTSRQTHPQTQTQVPPPPPPDASSMYSTFSSRPSGSTVPTTGTHTNITPYGSSSSSITTTTNTATSSNNNNNNNASTSTSTQPTQPPVEASSQSYNYNYTFSAKTGETYSRGGGSGMGTGTGTGQKRKKAVMDSEALEKYKRTHIDKVGGGGSGSNESSGSGVVGAGAGVGAGVSVGSVSRSEGIGAGAVAQSQAGASSVSEGNGNGVVAATAVAATGPTNREVEATQHPSENSSKRNWCANKACHRTLPVDYSGTLCEKCKERIKKRQQQAKQRFKLEPRKSLATGTSNGGVGRHDTPSVHQCG